MLDSEYKRVNGLHRYVKRYRILKPSVLNRRAALVRCPISLQRSREWLEIHPSGGEYMLAFNVNGIRRSSHIEAAALLALGVAMKLQLPQPGSAMTTVFIVMQPQSGRCHTARRGGNRISGTIMACHAFLRRL